MKHKVISLLQPWAFLVAYGAKRIETRSWNTTYRGPILIHASQGKQGMNLLETDIALHEAICSFFPNGLPELSFGAIIGQATIVDTLPTNPHAPTHDIERDILNRHGLVETHYWHLNKNELAFGDYSFNRWGWLLRDEILFREPIPARGSLSIWTWDGQLNPQAGA